MGFLAGKRILLTGLLSNRSIAYGIAQACKREGAELAFTYVGERFKDRITEFANEFGSDLVLRTLADATERTFSDVVEFTVSKDGKQLVYAVAAHDATKNGVFVVSPAGGEPTALLSGKGKNLGTYGTRAGAEKREKQVQYFKHKKGGK